MTWTRCPDCKRDVPARGGRYLTHLTLILRGPRCERTGEEVV